MSFCWHSLSFLCQSLISVKCFPANRYCSIQSVQLDIVTSASNWQDCHLHRTVTWSLGTYICISVCAALMETLYVFNTLTHTWLKYNISGNWISRLIIWWTDHLSTSFGLLRKSLSLNNLVYIGSIIIWLYLYWLYPIGDFSFRRPRERVRLLKDSCKKILHTWIIKVLYFETWGLVAHYHRFGGT